ncbi:hypothetical protein PDE_09955 [Penicillium oxalicum 114-2]|uniref:Uncharacterized protein n=1 Tax=Penicillium oxalicum (strain 114-2 / CGMCC 5302) TaxID=933388 RepID=S7ZW76_PENO1|nr:hypothetical protein PDE_09955 [Penicillium oxalicum 114-2]
MTNPDVVRKEEKWRKVDCNCEESVEPGEALVTKLRRDSRPTGKNYGPGRETTQKHREGEKLGWRRMVKHEIRQDWPPAHTEKGNEGYANAEIIVTLVVERGFFSVILLDQISDIKKEGSGLLRGCVSLSSRHPSSKS